MGCKPASCTSIRDIAQAGIRSGNLPVNVASPEVFTAFIACSCYMVEFQRFPGRFHAFRAKYHGFRCGGRNNAVSNREKTMIDNLRSLKSCLEDVEIYSTAMLKLRNVSGEIRKENVRAHRYPTFMPSFNICS